MYTRGALDVPMKYVEGILVSVVLQGLGQNNILLFQLLFDRFTHRSIPIDV